MEYWSGDIVNLSNENYLDHYKANNGQRNMNLIDEDGHPAIVIAGAESWGNNLPKNVYIVAKGQTFNANRPDYNLFDKNITNGVAINITIPRERNSTYMFSGELYIIDMNNTGRLSPQINTWKEAENPIPLRASNYDMLSLTTCIQKSQEPMLRKYDRLGSIVCSSFLDASKRVDINTFVKEDFERIYPVINSSAQVVDQYVHPNYFNILLNNKHYKPFNDYDMVSSVLNSIKLEADNEFGILEQKSITGNTTSLEERMYKDFKVQNDRNNEPSQYNYFDLDIDM